MNMSTHNAEGGSIDDIMVSLMAEVNNLKKAQQEVQELRTKCNELQTKIDRYENPDPRVVCLIDGDSALFARELYEQGWNGGTKACRNVIDAIRQGATEPHARRYDVQVYCFASKDNVIKAFSDHANGVSSAFSVQFDDFVKGFNSVEPGQAVMVDMRRGSEKSDVTVKVFLKREVQSPQVSSVIIAARYESYISELSGLRNSGFADKLKLLPSSVDRNDDCRHLQLGIMHPIRNVFQSGQSQSWRRGASSMNGHGASTDSPPTSSGSGSNPTSPTVVLPANGTSRSNGSTRMPCFKYHLTPYCKFGESCKSSHEPITSEQREALRAQAKKRPCDLVRNDMECRRRECPFGHECQYGAICRHYKEGKCNYGGAAAHNAN